MLLAPSMGIELVSIGQLVAALVNCTMTNFGKITKMPVYLYTDLEYDIGRETAYIIWGGGALRPVSQVGPFKR